MPREVITLHLGQAGCATGRNVWELLCSEHDIQPDGTRLNDDPDGGADDPFNAFFSETMSGQHVPRTVFLDTDPSVMEDTIGKDCKYRNLFHPESILAYKQDCKSNYFEGRTQAHQYHIVEETMNTIRKSVDKCDNLQGFFFFRSFGGGTGGGIGTELLNAIRDQFGKTILFEPAIYPSVDYSPSIVEPYNCLFSTAYSRETVDLSLMLDNQAAYKICETNLKVKNPSFPHLNRLIAQMLSLCTTSLRFETMLNASLAEVVTNIVPDPIFRYPIISLSPIRHHSRAKHESFSTAEIVTDIFEPKNILCDVGHSLRLNRFLAAAVLLRGTDPPPRTSASNSVASSGLDPMAPPIQVSDAIAAVRELANPKSSHREGLKFLPWLSAGGFKIGVVGVPPKIPEAVGGEPFMAPSTRQGALLGNTTAVRSLFVRQYEKFLKLFYHKAYIWQFLEANGELDMFYEAKEIVRNLIDDYEGLLSRSLEAEVDAQSLELIGSTGFTPGDENRVAENTNDNESPLTPYSPPENTMMDTVESFQL